MIVVIEKEVFQHTSNFKPLDKIIDLFLNRKHDWYFNNPNEILDSKWLETEKLSRLGRDVELVIKTAVSSAYISKKELSKRKKLIISNFSTSTTLDTNEALIYLSEPLFIILENLNSDQVFLKSISKAFGANEILEAIQKEWIKFDSEGGINGIPRRIDFHKSKHKYARLFVLVDSDKKFPTDSHKAIELEKLCSSLEINFRVLYKRAIENYIPESAFAGLPEEVNHVIQAYKKLNNNQKDFYNLKKGFENKGTLPKEQEELFDRMTSKDEVYKSLRKGFEVTKFNPNNLHKCFLNEIFVTKEALEGRCNSYPTELMDILNEILSLL